MTTPIKINVSGYNAFQLNQVAYNGPLFFARCWKCGKLDWKFGHFNGWNLCSTCLEEKLIEVGALEPRPIQNPLQLHFDIVNNQGVLL